jgi:hypothetical protein
MANKMAEWRLNRKIFTHRQKMMLAAKANGRFRVLKPGFF